VPYPYEYAVATQTWLDVLDAVTHETDLSTRNQAFTVLEGVLRAFRRRLEVQDALRFADEGQEADGRVALAFQSYAATRRAAAARLGHDDTELRAFIADRVREARAAAAARADIDPVLAATGLLATAEGLGVQLLSTDLTVDVAAAALQAQLDLTFGPSPGRPRRRA
jgi:uncharacterized protein (DUF2267 family)